ncbi:hypothetical protein J8M21_00870 [Pseudoalteromonas luteoviolacea]|uniref:hypothetical protein n=1 Tax=Pseudoalteromonas luteoviolacea TaxID=43657 RepID=UPI001B37E888|nr:hypothetical protein [Pseudoalteromonas luteoviolacea]MBQ4875752.1 hypothetical protein [Pseudoalteromonas luteoviolacea]MBQ4904787.1 hypothetical protein [Pseudoalteromonas luteoviolacea]
MNRKVDPDVRQDDAVWAQRKSKHPSLRACPVIYSFMQLEWSVLLIEQHMDPDVRQDDAVEALFRSTHSSLWACPAIYSLNNLNGWHFE